MKRLLLTAALVFACFTAACSNGGGITTAPPPTGNFSTSSLKGSYAFLMTGTSASTGDPISRVGSFIADGAGGITGAVEDANDAGTVNTVPFLGSPSSSYTVQANGQGTLTLAISPTSSLTFSFSLSTASQGYIIQTDGSSSSSGYFQLQTLSNAFSPAYAFDFSGVDISGGANSGAAASLVGQFTTNGTTGVTGGLLDVNDGAALTSTTISAAGIGPDPTYGATFGRGTFVIDNLSYIYYMIDQQHLVCVEAGDGQFATVGSATAQTSIPTTLAGLTNSFVFVVGGSTGGTGPAGPISRAARFTSDGSGALSNVYLDQNYSGTHKTYPVNTFTTPTITIDPAGSGRGTIAFTDSSTNVTFSYIFYLSTPTSGYIQDVTTNDIMDGSLSLQAAGPFTLSSQAGNYIVNWSGFNGNNSFEEDFVGQFALSTATTSNISGSTDYAELGSGQVITGAAMTGNLTVTGDGTLGGSKANTATITAGNQSFKFNAYILDSSNIVLIGTDTTRVVIGTATRQP